jgi:enamine deaminase RidA (YjgF/YER057c/UK114 family)
MNICRPSIERHRGAGIQKAILNRPDCREIFVTAWPLPGERPETLFARVAEAVLSFGGQIVSQKVFHYSEGKEACEKTLSQAFDGISWPITWLEEENGHDLRLAGTVVHAVAGPDVKPVVLGGRVVGCKYEEEVAEHLVLGDLRDANTSHSPAEQTQHALEAMVAGLASAGMDFSHVVRTWFWNHDILGWYDDFNKVRTEFYKKHRVFEGVLPASTGIGARNAQGAALVACLIATKPKSDSVKATAISSPLQSSACDYGSSFSRASELAMPDHRKLFISGTASIDKKGRTVHVDDVVKQVDLTMRVVEAILQSRGMAWTDVIRGLAYFRNAADAPAYDAYCRLHNLPKMPVIVTNNVVCREDLLFEIEVDGLRVNL